MPHPHPPSTSKVPGLEAVPIDSVTTPEEHLFSKRAEVLRRDPASGANHSAASNTRGQGGVSAPTDDVETTADVAPPGQQMGPQQMPNPMAPPQMAPPHVVMREAITLGSTSGRGKSWDACTPGDSEQAAGATWHAGQQYFTSRAPAAPAPLRYVMDRMDRSWHAGQSYSKHSGDVTHAKGGGHAEAHALQTLVAPGTGIGPGAEEESLGSPAVRKQRLTRQVGLSPIPTRVGGGGARPLCCAVRISSNHPRPLCCTVRVSSIHPRPCVVLACVLCRPCDPNSMLSAARH